MKNYVGYHNRDKMGGAPLDQPLLEDALSQKFIPTGSKVWHIEGTGKKSPKSFYLRRYSIVRECHEPSGNPRFRYIYTSEEGFSFEPHILLNSEAWFVAFKKSQQNFRFGLNPIAPEFVGELERIEAQTKARRQAHVS